VIKHEGQEQEGEEASYSSKRDNVPTLGLTLVPLRTIVEEGKRDEQDLAL